MDHNKEHFSNEPCDVILILQLQESVRSENGFHTQSVRKILDRIRQKVRSSSIGVYCAGRKAAYLTSFDQLDVDKFSRGRKGNCKKHTLMKLITMSMKNHRGDFVRLILVIDESEIEEFAPIFPNMSGLEYEELHHEIESHVAQVEIFRINTSEWMMHKTPCSFYLDCIEYLLNYRHGKKNPNIYAVNPNYIRKLRLKSGLAPMCENYFKNSKAEHYQSVYHIKFGDVYLVYSDSQSEIDHMMQNIRNANAKKLSS